jgi:hypothetical protein
MWDFVFKACLLFLKRNPEHFIVALRNKFLQAQEFIK